MSDSLYLLYRTGFAPTNGTSVFVSRLLEEIADSIVHLMWDTSEGGSESVKQVVVIENPKPWWTFRFNRGHHLYMSLRYRIGLDWWNQGQLNMQKLKRRLCTLELQPKRAWVICLCESDASKICAIWESIGKPNFVLHVLDIFNDRLSKADTPNFHRLINEAKHVICLSDNIVSEIMQNGAKSVSLLPFCSDFSSNDSRPMKEPLRIILSGTLWNSVYNFNPAVNLLLEAWEIIKCQFSGVELHYSGLSAKELPAKLLCEIQDHGLLENCDYEKLLRSCHLAYLIVSHPLNTVGRFSIPSRLGDYLACGLPVIACTDKGTAIDLFLHSLPDGCATNVDNVEGLLIAIKLFAGDAVSWKKASDIASGYAKLNLSIVTVRHEIFRQLERC